MNADVLNRLLQQPSLLKETTVADLEMMAYQYPWFGTAQLLLAAKQKQATSLNADKQVQKAMLGKFQLMLDGASQMNTTDGNSRDKRPTYMREQHPEWHMLTSRN